MLNMGQRNQSNSIFAELKRRNVFRVALLYIVAAWLLLQFSSVTFALLGIPDWVYRFLFTLLIICFPLLLAFSWTCEITPQGLRREQAVETGSSITAQTGQRINRITLILLSFTILMVMTDYLLPGNPSKQEASVIMETPGIDLQGHRGARGLLPENSIPAFLYALDLGVTTLEMDVAINARGYVVLSHEPWMSAKICSHPDGRPVTEDEERSLRIYNMSDAEVAGFDCGKRGHPDFPGQKAMPVSKPLLGSFFQAVALRELETERSPILFNIEIKSSPEGDGTFHPRVKDFASALHGVLAEHDTLDRSSIQSFDPRALEAMHEIDPRVAIVLLVANEDGLDRNLARLSFKPKVYSPFYKHLDKAQINTAHARNIQVIPWTVNDETSMKDLLAMGVDGLITDYPDVGIKVLAEVSKDQ